MRILPRPLRALILIAVAAGAYGYERLSRRHPPRVAEAPKPAAPARAAGPAVAAIAPPNGRPPRSKRPRA